MKKGFVVFRRWMLVCVVCFSIPSYGQDKVNIVAGFGFPEALNLGVRFQKKQIQVGFSAGLLQQENEKTRSFSGDIFYHFGGVSNLSSRRPWYGRVGLNYFDDETEFREDKYLFLNLRLGRDFNLSKRLGIAIDAGLVFELQHDEVVKKTPSELDWNFDINVPALPSVGVVLFYRL